MTPEMKMKNNVRHTIYNVLAASALLTITACSDEIKPTDTPSQRPIKALVSNEGMTRASKVVTLELLKTDGFKLDILAQESGQYGERRTVTHSGSDWTIDPEAFWYYEKQMYFWAYSNETASKAKFSTPTDSQTTLTFSYPNDGVEPDGQTDLLFAYTSKKYNESDETITLDFKHALSKIEFTTTNFNLPDGYTISGISLKGMKDSGTGTFTPSLADNFSWTTLSGDATFSADNTTDGFLVIPQNAENAQIVVKLTATDKEPLYISASMANYSMKAGKIYNYDLTMTLDRKLVVSMSVKPWTDDDQQMNLTGLEVAKTMEYSGVNILTATKQIVVKNGLNITGTFCLNEPIGSNLLFALDGNVEAFRIEQPTAIIDGNDITVTIDPIIDDPRKTYTTHLHVFLISPDGTTTQIDDEVLGEYADYSIILPTN